MFVYLYLCTRAPNHIQPPNPPTIQAPMSNLTPTTTYIQPHIHTPSPTGINYNKPAFVSEAEAELAFKEAQVAVEAVEAVTKANMSYSAEHGSMYKAMCSALVVRYVCV